MKVKDFNKWFNKMFEKVKVTDDDIDSGYGAWFRSNDDINEKQITNLSEMKNEFTKRKQQSKKL